jgi:uncharacterized protein (DUF3084 family)
MRSRSTQIRTRGKRMRSSAKQIRSSAKQIRSRSKQIKAKVIKAKQLEYDHTHTIEHILQSKLRQSNFEEYLVLEDHLKTINNRINNNFSVGNKLKLTEFNLKNKQIYQNISLT